eukprot:15273324-Ditylum_brightwellii.AAC.1
MEQSKFMVVTNGSAGEIDMSFGWKICILNRDILAEHAALSFFHPAMEYTASTKKLTLKMYLDNKGVITRIKKQQTYPNDFSFNTLTPDWDVIAQISNIHDLGNFIPTIQHIQGHRDKYKKYDELSLPAKLHVDADLLSVEYRALNKKTTRKVIRLP